jgi:hypothetical protein
VRDALRDGLTVTGLEGSHQDIAEQYAAHFVCRRHQSLCYRVTVSYKICAAGRQIVCVIPVVDIQVDRGERKGCTLQVESLRGQLSGVQLSFTSVIQSRGEGDVA